MFLQINDYSLVQFLPLDISQEDSIADVLLYIDNTIQYGEDLDVKVPKVCVYAIYTSIHQVLQLVYVIIHVHVTITQAATSLCMYCSELLDFQ